MTTNNAGAVASPPMDPATLVALKGSIAKWEGIVAGGPEGDCPLCLMFFRGRPIEDICVGCPVMERTGRRMCRGTPYWDDTNPKQAQAELDFLKSLLPKEAL